jgi:transglutaminase-like putative cysteine protease
MLLTHKLKTALGRVWNRGLVVGAVNLLAICLALPGLAEEYSISPEPSWVTPVKFSTTAEVPTEDISSGIYYLLSDTQIRVEGDGSEHFFHAAIKVINTNGIKDASQVSIDFDPEYEHVTLHSIRVHRDQTHTEQLEPDRVNVLQREMQLEYQIYDGSRSLNMFLDDVRIGDVVEYSYTREGMNPVFDGYYFANLETRWSVPVHQVRNRLLWPASRSLFIRNHRTDLAPVEKALSGYTEYRWNLDNVPPLFADDEIPDWYTPYPWVQLSEMGDWQEVVRWALKLYRVPDTLSPALEALVEEIARTYAGESERVSAVLRFVQDDVRYMGIEIGPQSHEPSDPSTVFERRFGDCKDKTLLALAMLRRLDIQAAPALVNSRLAGSIETYQPTPTVFNHVILKVISAGRIYWLDPTISLQRGPLEQLYQPYYGAALVLSAGVDGLERMAEPDNSVTTKYVEDEFDLRKGIGEQAIYKVKTVYTGRHADYMRRQFANTSRQETQKDYLNFYADQYASIRQEKEMVVEDNEASNRLTVTEHYLIPDLWEQEEGSNRVTAYFIPQDFNSYLTDLKSPRRTMPFSIVHPTNIRQKTVVHLPEEWSVETSHFQVEDPAFLFDMDVSYADDDLVIDYRYQTRRDHVAVADVEAYQDNIERVDNESGYYVSATVNSAGASGPIAEGGLNWATILLAVVVLLLTIGVSGALYRYDPPAAGLPTDSQAPSGIGGWLILVAIGVVAQPIRILVESYETKWIFLLDDWSLLTTPGSDSFHELWAPVLIFELAANITLVIFSVLLAILFFQKRSSLPKCYIYFLLWAVMISVVDSILVSFIPAAAEVGAAEQSALVRQGLFAAIWTAYFLKSQRVKATFVRRRNRQAQSVSTETNATMVTRVAARICPQCSSYVVKRTATKGQHKGKDFLVCKTYPKCQHVEPLTS